MRNKDYDYSRRCNTKTVLAKSNGLLGAINGGGDCSEKGSELDFCLKGAIFG